MDDLPPATEAMRLIVKSRTISNAFRQTRILCKRTEGQDSRQHQHTDQSSNWLKYALGVTAFGTVGVLSYNHDRDAHALSFGSKRPKEHLFSRQDVAKHDSIEKGVWITYKGNVYDITDFVKHHPGGSHTIMMGAGGDVEPFWKTYTVHEAGEVQKLLAGYQIGRLRPEDIKSREVEATAVEGPYANDPIRNPLLQVLTKEPFNAETPPKFLMPTNITPIEIFFVRNHLPVPEVDLKDYKLEICAGTDGKPDEQKPIASYTLDELKRKFKPYSIDCVIQCSGNRRNDLKQIKEIKGLGWGVGAIGNARWTGVRLVDILRDSGISLDDSEHKHIQLEGLDCDMSGQSYGASISADVAFDPRRDVLLAYEMNGEPLTRDHGFPLRFVAPGITGARNVKWLSKIILSDEESNSHWQRNDYKSFSPNVDMFNLDYKQSVSIQEMPVQSAICDPKDGDVIHLNELPSEGEKNATKLIPVKGYAYSGGGKQIVRVDVSIDAGKTWHTARLHNIPKNADGSPDYTNRNRVWSWTQWSIDIPIANDKRPVDIVCRAFDAAYNSQPERAETVWNVRGVVNNSWHRVRLNIVDQ